MARLRARVRRTIRACYCGRGRRARQAPGRWKSTDATRRTVATRPRRRHGHIDERRAPPRGPQVLRVSWLRRQRSEIQEVAEGQMTPIPGLTLTYPCIDTCALTEGRPAASAHHRIGLEPCRRRRYGSFSY